MKEKVRCTWLPLDKKDYVDYHDTEWGNPVHDDRELFECLMLEGAQAGLSWYTVLTKREGYRKVFKNFDAKKIITLTDEDLEHILINGPIIKNRLKVYGVRKNAVVFLTIQKEFKTFDNYLWSFVSNTPIVRNGTPLEKNSKEAQIVKELSKDLKKRGMTSVGENIVYAFMQAVGMVNDHSKNCYLAKH
jgi:DNA-3-methyladenine glycosylase I